MVWIQLWDPEFVAASQQTARDDRAPDAAITQEEMQRLNTLILDSETMDIDGIQFATGLRVLDIRGHVEGLENLVYCSSLTTLEISYDDVITNLKGISLPQSLKKTFKINHCSKLTSLDGLDTDSIPNLETFDASKKRCSQRYLGLTSGKITEAFQCRF